MPAGGRLPASQDHPRDRDPEHGRGLQTSYNPRRQLTDAAKRRVLAAYGLPPGTKVAEWDHLVARWAGGTSTSSNMFPQVNVAQKKRKDALEQRLYVAFCRGGDQAITPAVVKAACDGSQLTLECAREMMRGYWRWW